MHKLVAFMGIDPGAKGSFCLLVPSTKQIAFMSTIAKPLELMKWFQTIDIELNLAIIMIESVHSIYGMSAKSNFSFGRNLGRVETISYCTGNMVDTVTPKVWQKFVGVKSKGKAIKKNVADLCDKLYPHVNIYGPKGGLHDGKSDSLMIAHYASQTFKIY